MWKCSIGQCRSGSAHLEPVGSALPRGFSRKSGPSRGQPAVGRRIQSNPDLDPRRRMSRNGSLVRKVRVPIVQWIEPRFPKPLIRVRISVGALSSFDQTTELRTRIANPSVGAFPKRSEVRPQRSVKGGRDQGANISCRTFRTFFFTLGEIVPSFLTRRVLSTVLI